MTPTRMHDFVGTLARELPVPINVHCHNDLGLAVANSLAAVDAGARLVDVTVNGIGERCGITPLAPLATALVLTAEAQPRWRLDLLPELSRVVAQATGVPVPVTAPIVGDNAFAHNAGLHVAAVLQDPSHYEFIPAALVGRERRIVLDLFSGRAAVRHRLEGAGIQPTDELVDRVLHVVKGLEASDVSDADLRQLVRTIELARAPFAGAPL
jgi:2-isopropylmalate synthase